MPNTCSFESCDRGVVAKGLCAGHYRHHRAGEPLRPLKPWHSSKGVCNFPDCGRERDRAGLCRRHAAQHYRGQPLVPLAAPRTGCDFEGCPNPHRANGYCSSHLWQLDQGKQLTPLLGRSGKKHDRCTYPNCGRKHNANGLCRAHNQQLKRGQELRPIVAQQNRKVRHLTKQGYVLVRAPEGHPNANKAGHIFEHILVMTEMLGRPLAQGESVHHKNGLKDDNRPANLELWSLHQPKGGRVQDRLEWARWFLEAYGDVSPE